MNSHFVIPSLVLTALVSANAEAARNPNQQAALEGTTFAGLTIVGTVAAGPVGFLLGALGGAFLADQSRQANDANVEINNAKLAMAQASQQHAQLQTALAEQQSRVSQLEEIAVNKLTFQILFATGSDTLSDLDMQRVRVLADHLEHNPDLTVTLDGHADPRGTDEYNNVLSQERAKTIKNALEALGISAERIRYQGHGNRFSTAQKGDETAYGQERRVDVTIEDPATNPSYAHF